MSMSMTILGKVSKPLYLTSLRAGTKLPWARSHSLTVVSHKLHFIIPIDERAEKNQDHVREPFE
jgi:hypothetical protein